jgi:hypothetical protein
LGAIFTLIGAVALIASIIGFVQIKPLEFEVDKANLKAVGS